ncbi:restriction endonuclease [Aquibacillus albus]|uniref:Restriction system protein n=1 Tax=Aquibacillus albus TaxID=1168171 RepID=A0ABS2N0P7_9BACI|nr:restriction endonuclease [Aquibacillus albus]MBM7571690.1 restriction system protein [Aquibacillus albus]
MEFIIAAQFLVIGGLVWYIKKRNDQEANLIAKKIESSIDLKRTMAMGLAYRFNFPTENKDGEVIFKKTTNLFIKQSDFDFEEFVAEVMEKRFGGNAQTTVKVGDFGVDIEHFREDGLYLGQVKVYNHDLDYTPIALIHSNMMKQGAKGGYVITTSDFTPSARKYAEELNIELINGVQFVSYWLESMDSKVYEPTGEFA